MITAEELGVTSKNVDEKAKWRIRN